MSTLLFGGFGDVGESPYDLLALVQIDGTLFVLIIGIEQLQ